MTEEKRENLYIYIERERLAELRKIDWVRDEEEIKKRERWRGKGSLD